MKKAIIFPPKYIQGEGVLEEIGEITKTYGASKPMLVWGKRTRAASGDFVLGSLKERGLDSAEWAFEGECSKEQCSAIEAAIREQGCDIVVGLGGGKCLDISKAAAAHLGLRVIICPTVCSSDAPTSACTVWYSSEGVCTGFDLWPVNPDAIIVDTGIMVLAPEKMLKAGIGDALATYIEARAANRKHSPASSGGAPTMTAMALARICFDTLLEDTDAALTAVSAGVVNPSFERVVEACTLLSGVGWESGGLATAHQLGNNLTAFPEAHGAMHGEKVAFGIVTQFMLDPDVEMDEVYEVVDFMASVGLAVCFEDLSMHGVERERIMQWCENNTGEGAFTNNHSFPVGAKELYNAMLAADAFGRARKAELL
ncbi:MAG: glycerol dehydrogenase [Oscillospiraceae bacterium]|nr:glycerol dehydrogenase [Oscillospiraceae bacterium]